MLLSGRKTDGIESIVPLGVSKLVDSYLNYVFNNLARYYFDFNKSRLADDPDPRSLVIIWELGVRMPLYAWQHRSTLTQLFSTEASWMESSLGFNIHDILAVELAFEQIVNEILAQETPALSNGMPRLREICTSNGDAGISFKLGFEEEAINLWGEYQSRWSVTMASIGNRIALDIECIAEKASIDPIRVKAVMTFFTTPKTSIQKDYYIPTPDSPLKFRPFLKFDERWVLPDSLLFLPAIQLSLEHALNPAFGATSSDPDTWNGYQTRRAETVEERTASALSILLDGEIVHRNLKYKTTLGQVSPYELDGLALRDGKLVLFECKAGAFSSAARRGDIHAVEERINSLITDAHKQAIRALEYLVDSEQPVFRINGLPLIIEKFKIQEVS